MATKKKAPTTKAPKKRNPQDTTLRNVRAANHRVRLLAGSINVLNALLEKHENALVALSTRVADLEERAAKRRARGE